MLLPALLNPLNGLPKDEFAIQAEKSKKNNKPVKQQPMESLAEVTAVSQLTKPVTEKSHPETGKCDKRKKKKAMRSEEHTSELQSLRHLVCRLLLEKKNKK